MSHIGWEMGVPTDSEAAKGVVRGRAPSPVPIIHPRVHPVAPERRPQEFHVHPSFQPTRTRRRTPRIAVLVAGNVSSSLYEMRNPGNPGIGDLPAPRLQSLLILVFINPLRISRRLV